MYLHSRQHSRGGKSIKTQSIHSGQKETKNPSSVTIATATGETVGDTFAFPGYPAYVKPSNSGCGGIE